MERVHRFYGDMLEVSIGGEVDAAAYDALMHAAMASSGWFEEGDERISDIFLDIGAQGLREDAADRIGQDGRLVVTLPKPVVDPEASLEAVCRSLGLPYIRTLRSLDAGREDVAECWLPGTGAPRPLATDGCASIPPFITRF